MNKSLQDYRQWWLQEFLRNGHTWKLLSYGFDDYRLWCYHHSAKALCKRREFNAVGSQANPRTQIDQGALKLIADAFRGHWWCVTGCSRELKDCWSGGAAYRWVTKDDTWNRLVFRPLPINNIRFAVKWATGRLPCWRLAYKYSDALGKIGELVTTEMPCESCQIIPSLDCKHGYRAIRWRQATTVVMQVLCYLRRFGGSPFSRYLDIINWLVAGNDLFWPADHSRRLAVGSFERAVQLGYISQVIVRGQRTQRYQLTDAGWRHCNTWWHGKANEGGHTCKTN